MWDMMSYSVFCIMHVPMYVSASLMDLSKSDCRTVFADSKCLSSVHPLNGIPYLTD